MTRRKRTPDPQPSRKRSAFHIPASLQHLSAISRNLAQEADARHGVDKENENSKLVAQAQAMSTSSAPQSEQDTESVKFHDGHQKDFPEEQTWVRPEPTPSATRHARFLQTQWQEAQRREDARQATILVHRRQETENAIARQRTESEARAAQQAQAGQIIPVKANSSTTQQWPRPQDSRSQQKFDNETEKRRQAIIDKLKERNAIKSGSGASNVQTPGIRRTVPPPSRPREMSTGRQRHAESENSVEPGSSTSQQSSKIAALIAQKRAENAANGRLSGWLSARDRHQQLQAAASQGVPGIVQGPLGPPIRYPPSNVVPVLQPQAGVVSPRAQRSGSNSGVSRSLQQQHFAPTQQLQGEGELGQEQNHDIDLRSLFSSSTPKRPSTSSKNATRAKGLHEGSNETPEPASNDQVPTQLPSPAVSPPSQPEGQRVASPSAQLLNEIVSSSTPSTSFHEHQSPAFNRGHHWSERPQYSQMTIQKAAQSNRHQQPSSAGGSRQSQTPQTMLTADEEEIDVLRLAQHPSQYEAAQQLLEQLRHEDEAKHWNRAQMASEQWNVSPSSATSSSLQHPENYYRIKQHSWDSYSPDQFGEQSTSFVRSNSSSLHGSGLTGAGYGMNGHGVVYQPSRGPGYGSFVHGGSANANFRTIGQSGFQMSKR